MRAVDYIPICLALLAILAAVLASLEKLPWMKKHPQVLAWVTEAAAIAGQLRLELPPGSTLAQARSAAEGEAAKLVEKYAGGPTQAEATLQILGTLGHVVEDGHILPANAAPAVDPIMAALAKMEAMIAAQAAPAPAQVQAATAATVAPAAAAAGAG
jgi:hypothetical protein